MTIVDGECRTQRVALAGGEATWTVLGPDLAVVGPAEEFLEYLRVQGSSPNTVKSYARALGLWWSYLSLFGLEWDALTLSDVGGFLSWLRSGDGPVVVPIEPREPRFAESTVSARLRAVTSCYRFHELNGVALGGDLVRSCTADVLSTSRCWTTSRGRRAGTGARCGCGCRGARRRRCCPRLRSRRSATRAPGRDRRAGSGRAG